MKPAAEAAAKAACGWLAARGFRVEERLEEGPSGKKLNVWMKVRRERDGSSFAGAKFSPAWDWVERRIPREDAWLRLVEWLFLEGGDGPGWTVEKNGVSPIPKFSFSSLEEFVLKAAVAGL